MNQQQRLQLQKMIKTNNVEDQTQLIRDLKHSEILKKDINKLLNLKKEYNNDQDKIHTEAMFECTFLFNYYTDIYNKIRKDEIDLSILYRFINILKDIEDEKIDQHEGAFNVGTLLKELYIDSALKKSEKLDKQQEGEKNEYKEPVKISWSQFKNNNT